MSTLPEKDAEEVKKRIEKTMFLHAMSERNAKAYKDYVTTDIVRHAFNLNSEGLRKECPAAVDEKAGDFGFCRSKNVSNTKQPDYSSIIATASKSINHHCKTSDNKPNLDSISAALAVKPKLEALEQLGDTGAKRLLGYISEIEQAQKDGYKNMISFVPDVTCGIVAQNKSKYKSLTHHIKDYMGREGLDFDKIRKMQHAQADNSWKGEACNQKVCIMEMRGLSIDLGKKDSGIYYGGDYEICLKKAISDYKNGNRNLQ